MAEPTQKAKPIPVPQGGFTSNEDEARWLADTIAMRVSETLREATGISSKWPTDSLYELLLDALGAAARRARKEAGKDRDAARQQGYRETQRGVSDWATETFGPAGSNCRVAARANEEMAELLRALSSDDAHPKAAEEVADIVIILYRLVERLGTNLHAEIDRKMAINRSRNWGRDGTGHGYHIPTTPAPKET